MDSSYTILGLVPGNCTKKDVSRAYRNLALWNHPDKVGSIGEAMMKALNAARDDILHNDRPQTPISGEECDRTYDHPDSDVELDSDSEYTDEDEDIQPATPLRSVYDFEAADFEDDPTNQEDDYVHVDKPHSEADAKKQPEDPFANTFTMVDSDCSTSSEFFSKMSERLHGMHEKSMDSLLKRLNYLGRFDERSGQIATLLKQRLKLQFVELRRTLHCDCHDPEPSKHFCTLLAQMLMTVRQLHTIGGRNLEDARAIDKACDLPFMLDFTGISIHEPRRSCSLKTLTKMMNVLLRKTREEDAERETLRLDFVEPWLRECYPIMERRWNTEVTEWNVAAFWEYARYG